MENGKKECNNNQHYETTEKSGSHLWEKHKHKDIHTNNIRKAAVWVTGREESRTVSFQLVELLC